MKPYIPRDDNERNYLDNYNLADYPVVGVTADVVMFTLTEDNELAILLIKRGINEQGSVYQDTWAVPGGFIDVSKDTTMADTAARELYEETGLKNIPLVQFDAIYNMYPNAEGKYDKYRDPRGPIISVVYMAFVPKDKLKFEAGDDASDAQLFKIRKTPNGKLVFVGNTFEIPEEQIAFDHAEEGKHIKGGIAELRARIDRTEDAFNFLKNPKSFTIFELKKIYEAVKGEKEDTANFRRDFIRKYVNTGKCVPTGEFTENSGHRAAALYKRVK